MRWLVLTTLCLTAGIPAALAQSGAAGAAKIRGNVAGWRPDTPAGPRIEFTAHSLDFYTKPGAVARAAEAAEPSPAVAGAREETGGPARSSAAAPEVHIPGTVIIRSPHSLDFYSELARKRLQGGGIGTEGSGA
jgi:hypothetical protein